MSEEKLGPVATCPRCSRRMNPGMDECIACWAKERVGVVGAEAVEPTQLDANVFGIGAVQVTETPDVVARERVSLREVLRTIEGDDD